MSKEHQNDCAIVVGSHDYCTCLSDELMRLRADLAKAQAEVAELRARIDRSVCLDSEGERIHFGARVVCGQCFDSQEQHLKNARTRLADAEKRRCDYMCDACSLALAACDSKWRAGK